MGICISSASSEIHQAEDEHENGVYLGENIAFNGVDGLGSLYSKEGSKKLNQDAAILHQGYGEEDGAFCGVFDGHGKNGHIVSKIVRNMLPSLLLSQKNALAKTKIIADGNTQKIEDGLFPSKNFHLWNEACISAFKAMDKEVKLQESLDFSCSGTTAVVVVRQGEDLVIANLGDSRAILGTIKDNGIMAVQLTNDLKPSVPSEAARIRKCNGRVLALKEEPHIQRVWLPHEDLPGLAMSRAFGDFLLKTHGIIALPEISYHRLTSDDQFIVLASDGVWDVLSNNEVASIVWAADSETAAAKAVVEAATATWKTKYPFSKVDDCTAVCLFLHKKQRRHAGSEDFIY
ncbi:probable protein phosphatase 2C 72 [Ricinus communis]|uniref:Protein phosphatase-2c, putative n=1 Tax=Ricinus communis TaxID=3988 RepID=B9RRV1_RICCO|nr:probable protein phosphatase 2C 72 [Ricinus communis]EEF45811.1 protein phosphatase-2c, putative [Ricinus communis]|eukprot:XP_002516470.1 probable protein phosphatase 2C 72 [Ricinus communis]